MPHEIHFNLSQTLLKLVPTRFIICNRTPHVFKKPTVATPLRLKSIKNRPH